MTDEFPWLTEGSEPEPTNADRDPFQSLGLEFTEESPTIAASVPAAIVTDGTRGSALDSLSATHPSDVVVTSRRALREAERSTTGSRRARRGAVATTVVPAATNATITPAAITPAAITPGARAIASRTTVTSAPRSTPSSRVPLGRRIAKKTFPPVVMLSVAALLVGTSVPANALFDPDAPPASIAMSSMSLDAATAVAPEGQVIEVDSAEDIAATAATRDEWSVTSYAELLRLKYGSRSFSYSTTGTGAVRWPFPYAVPIASGYGERVAPCRWCSSYHQGLDFNPGAGTPIYAIADGVVLQSEYSGGFGQHAIIEHVINGQTVTSTYAHMTGGSSPLVPGQQVLVGDFVGTVGSTGTSTGAHLHFEIRIDGLAIDPYAWLQANAS